MNSSVVTGFFATVNTVKASPADWEYVFGQTITQRKKILTLLMNIQYLLLIELNFFYESANILAALVMVFNFIHDGFHKPDTEAPFAFFVNKISDFRFAKLVYIEYRS